MEIQEFLNLWVDRWFALRSTYQINQDQFENSKSEMTIESLSVDHPEVTQLCQAYQIQANLSLGGLKTHWDNSVDWGQPKQTGTTLVVWIPESDHPQQGQILHKGNGGNTLAGRYILDEDEALTLTVEEAQMYWQERVWFATPNLRLRTSLIKYSQGWIQSTFYSEIRRIAPTK